jgi:ABC-type Fe3+/spermidine/putrescine transport system ATPase subunit
MTMLEIVNISNSISGRQILKDISITVEKGKILTLLGASGAGKSSLLRLVAGLDKPDGGEIRIEGRTVSSPSSIVAPSLRKISMIFQDLALWPHMTVRSHLEFVIDRKRYGAKTTVLERIEQLLSLVHMPDMQKRFTHELSGGERQRLAIARALASDPEYLLMDEPFSNLDDLLKRGLLQLTLGLRNDKNMTIVYVTHSIEEAVYLADSIAVLNSGRIVRIWDKKDIVSSNREEILKTLY